MSTELYKEVNYNAQLNYYSGCIVEYDLRKANISALLTRGVIDKDKYNFLYNCEKEYREYYIGMMIKSNPDVYKEIQAGIIEAKRLFVELNNIQDEEILEIRNDALFLLTERPIIEQVGSNYYFVKKNSYTFFFRMFNGHEFFYRYDSIQNLDIVQVKGINEDNIKLHQKYMIKFITDTIFGIEQNNIENVISKCNTFYSDYLTRALPVEYYREFNNISMYRIYTNFYYNKSFLTPGISQNQLKYLDIGYNLRIIRDIITMVDSIYLQKIR